MFFEWLSRVHGEDRDLGIVDQAEQRVLWDIEALLETLLVEPFDRDYDVLLEAARRGVRDPTD